jgi:hypothetical protein
MSDLTPEEQQIVSDVAQQHGVSADAVLTLLRALVAGQGTMAQFNHPELGGMGQWTQGGMTMVGSMFDHDLKARVDPRAVLHHGSDSPKGTPMVECVRHEPVHRWGGLAIRHLVAIRIRPPVDRRISQRPAVCHFPGGPPACN